MKIKKKDKFKLLFYLKTKNLKKIQPNLKKKSNFFNLLKKRT